MAESYRILKPGGWLLASVPYYNWRHILADAFPLAKWDHTYTRASGYRNTQRFYQWRFTPPELERELALKGFRVNHIFPIHKNQGASRILQTNLWLIKPETILFRGACRILARLIPANLIAHMLLVVAQKPE